MESQRLKIGTTAIHATYYRSYKFTFVDVGGAGRQSDEGVLATIHLGFALEHGKLCLPKPKCSESYDKAIPCVFKGDKAFPLKEYLIKPYLRTSLDTMKRNYRISRARNLVENVLGICASRFRKCFLFLHPQSKFFSWLCIACRGKNLFNAKFEFETVHFSDELVTVVYYLTNCQVSYIAVNRAFHLHFFSSIHKKQNIVFCGFLLRMRKHLLTYF